MSRRCGPTPADTRRHRPAGRAGRRLCNRGGRSAAEPRPAPPPSQGFVRRGVTGAAPARPAGARGRLAARPAPRRHDALRRPRRAPTGRSRALPAPLLPPTPSAALRTGRPGRGRALPAQPELPSRPARGAPRPSPYLAEPRGLGRAAAQRKRKGNGVRLPPPPSAPSLLPSPPAAAVGPRAGGTGAQALLPGRALLRHRPQRRAGSRPQPRAAPRGPQVSAAAGSERSESAAPASAAPSCPVPALAAFLKVLKGDLSFCPWGSDASDPFPALAFPLSNFHGETVRRRTKLGPPPPTSRGNAKHA